MKKLLFLIPTVIFPYLFCGGLLIGFGAGWGDAFVKIWAIILVACVALSLVFNVIYMVLSRKQDAHHLVKVALIIKLLHIPTYALIFVFGLLMGFMFIMTFPFILFLVYIDCLTMVLSGMISVFALIKSFKNNRLVSILTLVCQPFFCVDIISLFIANCILKKQEKAVIDANEN